MANISQFELRKKLQEALQNGRYFITITALNNKTLSHYYTWENFPGDDLIPSLGHIAREIDAKDNP